MVTGLAESNNEAKRLIRQGGIKLGGEQVSTEYSVAPAELPRVLSRGKLRSVLLVPA